MPINAIIVFMEEAKKKKTLKILSWCLLAVAIAAIIVMSIVSSVLKDKADDINKDNSQIEEILPPQTSE